MSESEEDTQQMWVTVMISNSHKIPRPWTFLPESRQIFTGNTDKDSQDPMLLVLFCFHCFD